MFSASAAPVWAQIRPIPPAMTPRAAPTAEPVPPPAYPPAPGPAAGPSSTGGTGDEQPPPPPVAAPRTFVPPLQFTGPVVHLHADNPRARLQRLTGRWVDVCTDPCGETVASAGQYRVGGGSIKASSVFQLPPGARSVQVTASTGSVAKYWIGAGLAINGAVSLALAAIFLGAQTNTMNTFDNGEMRDVQHTYGVAYLVMGIVSLAVGLPLWMGNNTTVQVR